MLDALPPAASAVEQKPNDETIYRPSGATRISRPLSASVSR